MKEIPYRSLVRNVVNRITRTCNGYAFKEEHANIIIKLAFELSKGYLETLKKVHGPNLDRESNVSIVGNYGNAIKALCTSFKNYISGVTKPVNGKREPVRVEQMIYKYVKNIIEQKYPNFKYLKEIPQEYVMHVIRQNGGVSEITPTFFRKIVKIIVKTYHSPLISNSKSVLDEHSKIFADLINIFGIRVVNGKTDAEVIDAVIRLNNMWNNADFDRILHMGYDEVLDRVSKILNSHINSKCDYDPGKLYEIYKICLNFLRTRQSSLVKKMV